MTISLSTIVWFRQDLRIADHSALDAALQKGGNVIPLYIWAPEEEKEWAPGGASRWWLHHSLEALEEELDTLGLPFIIRMQPSYHALLEVAKETQADAIFWNRRYEPAIIKRDAQIKSDLQKNGIQSQSFNGTLLFEPWTILNKQRKPFQVFTPFWKNCCAQGEPKPPLPIPSAVKKQQIKTHSESLSALQLLPSIPWDKGLQETWKPGAKNGQKQLQITLSETLDGYTQNRDYPSLSGTSKLSPFLHFGEITSRIIWHAIRQKTTLSNDNEGFLRQLVWREFGYSLLYHFPHTPNHALYPKFDLFPWKKDTQTLSAWQKGTTGYPIVDAGMRQLWHTGWMHNRLRMIVGSFLVKDLLIPWQEGARWFWDTLVDADLANNTLGWQWVAGCGADAAPYFRIFNPLLQSQKFDGEGKYIRQWVPELKDLPDRWIHQPAEAPPEILRSAGITLGVTYPYPIVDHSEARQRALQGYTEWNKKDED
jgi:deoxyribodipyrimidine photo-lyase